MLYIEKKAKNVKYDRFNKPMRHGKLNKTVKQENVEVVEIPVVIENEISSENILENTIVDFKVHGPEVETSMGSDIEEKPKSKKNKKEKLEDYGQE